MIVTTLPITLRENLLYQIYLSPLAGDLFAKFSGSTFIPSINVTGLRFSESTDSQKEVMKETYSKELDRLGVKPPAIWSDDDPSYRKNLQEIVDDLYGQGLLREIDDTVMTCGCGRLEIQSTMREKLRNSKVVKLVGGEVTCKICGTAVRELACSSLVIDLPPHHDPVEIFPRGMSSEVRELYSSYDGVSLRISREREGNLPVRVNSSVYHLDTDFLWSFFPLALASSGESQVMIVTSNRTILQATRVSRLTSLLRKDLAIGIMVNPMIDSEKKTLAELNEKAVTLGSDVQVILRTFLALNLRWNGKVSKQDTTALYWIAHSIRDIRAVAQQIEELSGEIQGDGASFMSICSGARITELLTRMRKKRSITSEQARLAAILLG